MRQGLFPLLITLGDIPSPADDCRVLRDLAKNPKKVRELAPCLSQSARARIFQHLPAGPYRLTPAYEQDFRLRLVDIPLESLSVAAVNAREEIYKHHNVAKGGRGLKSNKGLVQGPMQVFMIAMIKLYAEVNGADKTTATIDSLNRNCYEFVSAAFWFATHKKLNQGKKFKKAIKTWKSIKPITALDLFTMARGSAPDSPKAVV
jgi:hypothetical protein